MVTIWYLFPNTYLAIPRPLMKITLFDSIFFGSVRQKSHLLVLKIGGYVMQFKKMYETSNTHYLADNQKTIFSKFLEKSLFFSLFFIFLCSVSQVSLFGLSTSQAGKKKHCGGKLYTILKWYDTWKSLYCDSGKNFLSYAKFLICPLEQLFAFSRT